MERSFKGPVLLEEAPRLQEANDIMYFWEGGACTAAMRMEVFESYIYAGMEEVTSWRNRRQKPASRRPAANAANCGDGAIIPFKR